MKKKILLIPLALLLAISLVATACPAPAPPPAPAPAPHEIVTIDLLTAPFGSGVYTEGLAISDIAEKVHPWLRIKSAEAPGYAYNLRLMEENPALWKTTAFGTARALDFLAREGALPFEEKLESPTKYLASQTTYGMFFVTLDPEIRTVDDFVGKKLAMGYPHQIDSAITPKYLLDDGLGIYDQIDVKYTGNMEAMYAMIDGTIDISIQYGTLNPITKEFRPGARWFELLGSGKDIYLIDIPKEAFDNLFEKTGLYTGRVVLPAGTLETQTEDFAIWANAAEWAVKAVFPDELAYEFTKLYVENYKRLWEYHAKFELYSPEAMAFGLTKREMHPGSIKAFEELGLTIPEE